MASRQQYLVIGLGRFGGAVGQTLVDLGHEVLGVDVEMRLVQEHADELTETRQLDATDPEALEQIGAKEFDVAIVAVGTDLEASIVTTSNLSELGVRQIVAKALSRQHARILDRVGAHRVVFPEHEAAVRLAYALTGANVLETIEMDPAYAIEQMPCPADAIGKTIAEADLRAKASVLVLAVKSGDDIELIPGPRYRFARHDEIVVAGTRQAVDALRDGTGRT